MYSYKSFKSVDLQYPLIWSLMQNKIQGLAQIES